MIEMPLAMNNTFTINCTWGEELHDQFPLLGYAKNRGEKIQSSLLKEAEAKEAAQF